MFFIIKNESEGDIMRKNPVSFLIMAIVLTFNWGCGTSYSSKYLEHIIRNSKSSQQESADLQQEVIRLQQEITRLQRLRQQSALVDDMKKEASVLQKESVELLQEITKLQKEVQNLRHLQQQSVLLNERAYFAGEVAKEVALMAKEIVIFLQNLKPRKELVNFFQRLVSQMQEQSEKASQAAQKAYEVSGLLKEGVQYPELEERALQNIGEAEQIAEEIHENIGVVFFSLNEAEKEAQLYDHVIFVVHHGQKMCMFLNKKLGQNESDCILSLDPGWTKVPLKYPLLERCPKSYTQKEDKQCPIGYRQGVFRMVLK